MSCGLLLQLMEPKSSLAEKYDFMLRSMQKLAGNEFIGFNNAVFLSERETADRNFAMGYYMKVGYSNIGYNVGPSGVRALPLAAGINVGGHYKWHFFLSLSSSGSLLILPEGVVIGIQIFAWAPN